MRKLLLILFIFSCFFASAQKIQYVNTYGYQYQRLVADTLLGLPKDTFTVPTALRTIPFLANKAGTLYKWNISTFVWDAFSGSGSTETASEGLEKIGNDIRFGGLVSSPAALSNDRNILVNRRILIFGNTIPGAALWQFSDSAYSPFQFLTSDTITSNDMSLSRTRPLSGLYAQRNIVFTPGIYQQTKLLGHRLGTKVIWTDSVKIRTDGGDYHSNHFDFWFAPQGSGRQVAKIGHGTGSENRDEEAVSALVNNMIVQGNDVSSSDSTVINGTIAGTSSYLNANLVLQKIRIKKYVAFLSNNFIGANTKIEKLVEFGSAFKLGTNSSLVDSAYFMWDTSMFKRNHLRGSTHIGTGLWSNSYNFSVGGISNFSDTASFSTVRNIADTTGYDLITRRRTDGVLTRITSTQLNTFLSGGGGANAALSNLSGVAINTSLISDANNTDDLGSSANAWKDAYAYRYIAKGSTSGTVEYKSDALGNAPNVTTLSGTGYGVSWMETRETSDFTGSNINTVQPVFNTSGDVFTLQGSTSYDFEGVYSFNHGAASHSVGLSFELGGGASVTSITYTTICWVTAIGTNTASQTTNLIQTTANTAVNAAGANATEQIMIKGTINMNAGGTVTPSYTFSAAPGGTVLTKAGSYIKFTPKGTNTFTTIGNVN